MAWTIPQQRALAIVPKISATLSIIGSVFIIADIVRSREKLGRTYSRILLVMSTYDFCTSVAQGMSTWPIPEGTAGVQYAAGTTFTCNFQGFFTQLGVGAPMYNCSLSFYYLIVIAFAFSEDRVKRIEWFMHGIPLFFSIGTAIAGLPLTLYNSAGLWCWISALPGSCGNNPDSTGECIRGDHAWVYRWAIYYGPVWFCVLTITINMTIVSYLVWAKEKASLRFRFGHKSHVSNASGVSEVSGSFEGMDEAAAAKARAGRLAQYMQKKQLKRQQKQKQGLASQVFWQAFYYVLGFYITWIFPTVLRLLQTIEKPVPYWVVVAMATLLPMQGFFNFLVYVRPRVVQYHNRHPEKSIWSAISRAVRRTVNIVYVSESRRYADTEIQDIEALDPCYALQVEKENEEMKRRESEQIKTLPNAQLASTRNLDAGTNYNNNAYRNDFESIEEESNRMSEFSESRRSRSSRNFSSRNSMEKAPDPDDQRRVDEMKLLMEDDPSFHEANSSRFSSASRKQDEKTYDDDSEPDVYLDEDSMSEAKDDNNMKIGLLAGVAAVGTQKAGAGKAALKIKTTREERKEAPEVNAEEKESIDEVAQYTALKSTRVYFYPEFTHEPDFYFM